MTARLVAQDDRNRANIKESQLDLLLMRIVTRGKR